jgi:hypothetical protein
MACLAVLGQKLPGPGIRGLILGHHSSAAKGAGQQQADRNRAAAAN